MRGRWGSHCRTPRPRKSCSTPAWRKVGASGITRRWCACSSCSRITRSAARLEPMPPLKQRKRKRPGQDRATRRAPTLADVARIAGVSEMPAAIILTGVVHSPESRRRLLGAQIPVVETWDLTPTPIDMLVGFSNENIGRAAAEYLIERGRQRLALIVADDQRAQVRRKGFVAALEERGRTPVSEVVLRAPTTLGMGREAFGNLLADHSFDAVFCTSDQLAMGVLYEASARGIKVPGQVAVMGFGDLAASAHAQPSLTTVAVDGKRIGEEATRMLLERFDKSRLQRRPAAQIVDVGFRVIARESA